MINKRIYILGAGAIGKALAVFLKFELKDVVLVRTSTVEKFSAIEKISVELNDNSLMDASIGITSLEDLETLDGIVVLTNKSFANRDIAKRLKSKAGKSPIVVMQNGLNVEEPFFENNFPIICRCVLFATSQITSAQTVRFKPVAISPIGILKGDEDQLQQVVVQLNNAHLQFKTIDDIQPIIWKKTIANCVFNSICPLLDIDNGLFYRNAAALTIAQKVIHECVTIAREAGIALDLKEVLDTVLLISKSSDGQLISTLQDIKNGRETEIESLNFAIAKIAADRNMTDVVANTKLLGELIKLKSTLMQKQ
jgi:2-dehydropantoate 2-reductase